MFGARTRMVLHHALCTSARVAAALGTIMIGGCGPDDSDTDSDKTRISTPTRISTRIPSWHDADTPDGSESGLSPALRVRTQHLPFQQLADSDVRLGCTGAPSTKSAPAARVWAGQNGRPLLGQAQLGLITGSYPAQQDSDLIAQGPQHRPP
jgi:hypothetical protein